jgi:flagellar biogenesis protein FliO
LPFVPLLLVVFLIFFFNRIKKRRGRKYGGLRILGD